jgi:hypothetical protein
VSADLPAHLLALIDAERAAEAERDRVRDEIMRPAYDALGEAEDAARDAHLAVLTAYRDWALDRPHKHCVHTGTETNGQHP